MTAAKKKGTKSIAKCRDKNETFNRMNDKKKS